MPVRGRTDSWAFTQLEKKSYYCPQHPGRLYFYNAALQLRESSCLCGVSKQSSKLFFLLLSVLIFTENLQPETPSRAHRSNLSTKKRNQRDVNKCRPVYQRKKVAALAWFCYLITYKWSYLLISICVREKTNHTQRGGGQRTVSRSSLPRFITLCCCY